MPHDIDLSKQTEALLAINKAVMAGADFSSVMEAVVKGTLIVLPQAHGAVVELREGEEIIYASASGSMAKHVGLRIKVAGSLSGRAMREERLLYCSDSETDPRVDRAACRRVGLRSMIIAPLIHRHQCLGILKIYSNDVNAFNEQDKIVAQFFVTLIAAGFGSVVDGQATLIMQEFVNMATHELRTPLTSLKGALELMSGLHKVELPADVQNLLEIALKGSNRLMLLINDLLTIGKLDAGKMVFAMKDESLDDMLSECVRDLSSYRKSITFQVDAAATGIRIATDRGRFVQVMANLMSNAAKFSAENGSVVIRTDLKDGKALISVIDHGEGIPLEFQAKIFQKFAQAGVGQGSGLGLHIAKEFVEKMQGRIWFKSEEGKGTTFFLEFQAL